jgi:hypothetical protein
VALTFEDELVEMHDAELSLPSVQVSLEKHLALMGAQDTAAERRRLAAAFAAKRGHTRFGRDILKLLRGGSAE